MVPRTNGRNTARTTIVAVRINSRIASGFPIDKPATFSSFVIIFYTLILWLIFTGWLRPVTQYNGNKNVAA